MKAWWIPISVANTVFLRILRNKKPIASGKKMQAQTEEQLEL